MGKNSEPVCLDNRTIVKLAMAIATAMQLQKDGEVIGPMTRKMMEEVDAIDSLEQFRSYK